MREIYSEAKQKAVTDNPQFQEALAAWRAAEEQIAAHKKTAADAAVKLSKLCTGGMIWQLLHDEAEYQLLIKRMSKR